MVIAGVIIGVLALLGIGAAVFAIGTLPSSEERAIAADRAEVLDDVQDRIDTLTEGELRDFSSASNGGNGSGARDVVAVIDGVETYETRYALDPSTIETEIDQMGSVICGYADEELTFSDPQPVAEQAAFFWVSWEDAAQGDAVLDIFERDVTTFAAFYDRVLANYCPGTLAQLG